MPRWLRSFGFLLFFLSIGAVPAAAVLYIDDTSTVDKGHWELQLSEDYFWDGENEFNPDTEQYDRRVSKENVVSALLTYGLSAKCDLGIGVPYKLIHDSINGKTSGFGNTGIRVKYRFLEEGRFFPSYALSFDAGLPTSIKARRISAANYDFTLMNIFTKYFGKNSLDLNLGYNYYNDSITDDELVCIIDFSRDLTSKLNACLEVYADNTLKGDLGKNNLACAVSLAYDFNDQVCLESGVGFGIAKASPDYQYSMTLTVDF